MIWMEETRENINVGTDDSKMTKIWPLLLKSSWSMQKFKNIRQKENNAINEKCCVYLCMRERETETEREKTLWLRKQFGENKFISVRTTVLRENAQGEGVWPQMHGEWESQSLPDVWGGKWNQYHIRESQISALSNSPWRGWVSLWTRGLCTM